MSFRILILFGAATVLLGQTPPPNPPTPRPVPQIKLSMDNPAVKQPEVPPDRVVITVGDIKITAAQFNSFIDTLQPQAGSDPGLQEPGDVSRVEPGG